MEWMFCEWMDGKAGKALKKYIFCMCLEKKVVHFYEGREEKESKSVDETMRNLFLVGKGWNIMYLLDVFSCF